MNSLKRNHITNGLRKTQVKHAVRFLSVPLCLSALVLCLFYVSISFSVSVSISPVSITHAVMVVMSSLWCRALSVSLEADGFSLCESFFNTPLRSFIHPSSINRLPIRVRGPDSQTKHISAWMLKCQRKNNIMREESGSIKPDGSSRWELAGGKRLPFMRDVSRPLSPGADDVTPSHRDELTCLTR